MGGAKKWNWNQQNVALNPNLNVYQAKLGISNVFFFWGLKGMLTSDSKKEISTKLTKIVEREQ